MSRRRCPKLDRAACRTYPSRPNGISRRSKFEVPEAFRPALPRARSAARAGRHPGGGGGGNPKRDQSEQGEGLRHLSRRRDAARDRKDHLPAVSGIRRDRQHTLPALQRPDPHPGSSPIDRAGASRGGRWHANPHQRRRRTGAERRPTGALIHRHISTSPRILPTPGGRPADQSPDQRGPGGIRHVTADPDPDAGGRIDHTDRSHSGHTIRAGVRGKTQRSAEAAA